MSHYDSQPVSKSKFRFSLKAVLVIVTFVAMVSAMARQSFRLAKTQASLSRYESSMIPTTLALNQFRVIKRVVLDTTYAKVNTYRIESTNGFFVTLKNEGGSAGSCSTYDPNTRLYFREVIIFIDYIKSKHALKVHPKMGGAQGYSVYTMPEDFSFEESFVDHDLQSVYLRNESVELFELDGRAYTLTLKP